MRRVAQRRPGNGGSSWTAAAIGSAVFHVGLVVLAAVLPEGGPPGGASSRDKLFTPGAVIPIEVEPLPRVAASTEPTHDPRLPSPSDDTEAPAIGADERPHSRSPDPRAGAEPPPDPAEAEAQPSNTPGLSLHGMRDSARAATAGAGKVVVDPSLLGGGRDVYEGSIGDPGVGGGAVQGPAQGGGGAKDFAFTKEKGKLVYRDPSGRFVATLSPDGRVNFRNKGAKGSWTNIGLAGPGDLLDAAGGNDPYARLKAKLLEATFEMRLGMAVAFQKKQLDKRLNRLDGELDKIWADERRDLAARKELLFQRWDECDEPDEVMAAGELPGFGAVESSELDEARQSAAASARKRILKFIREHAPRGSAEAFTAAELADMNRRRASKEKFNPYD